VVPGSILPESNDPVTEVIVCVTSSLLVQVTVLPIGTYTVVGTKLRLVIFTFTDGCSVGVGVAVGVGVVVSLGIGVGVGVGV